MRNLRKIPDKEQGENAVSPVVLVLLFYRGASLLRAPPVPSSIEWGLGTAGVLLGRRLDRKAVHSTDQHTTRAEVGTHHSWLVPAGMRLGAYERASRQGLQSNTSRIPCWIDRRVVRIAVSAV